MWRKRQEFRPDKTGTGVLSKLYMTKRQRRHFLQWVLYALVLVVLSLIQDVILCQVRLLGATTDLVSTGILLLCMMLTTQECAPFAVAASTAYYFSGMAAGPYSILFLSALGIFLNIFRYSYLRKSFGSTYLCAAAALVVYELLVFITGVFLEHTVIGRIGGFAITAGLSVAVMPVLYPVFKAIGSIGGETWKE